MVNHKCANCGAEFGLGQGFIVGLVECPRCGFKDWVMVTEEQKVKVAGKISKRLLGQAGNEEGIIQKIASRTLR